MRSDARREAPGRPRLGARDQARRLWASGPAEWRSRAPVHAPRLRLECSLSRDCRHRGPAPRQVVHGSTARPWSAVRTASRSSTFCTGTAPSPRPCCTLSISSNDLLELDGEDLRVLPLGDRKKRLARLLGRRRVGIVLSAHTAEDGATVFQQACRMGLEGVVSKRLSAPYRSGPSRDWLKVKNPGRTSTAAKTKPKHDRRRC